MNSSNKALLQKTEEIEPMKLSCFSLLQNGFIPSRYTSDGININPSLYIDDIPGNAKSFAIIVEDPDVPHGNFCHWVAWNIPVTHHIKEKENRGVFGINDFCNHGYNGPHPFSLVHRYHFKVYALDCVLNIPASSTKWELKAAMRNHIVGFGVVTGKYQKHIPHKNGIAVKQRQVFSDELKMLLKENGNTCVSIILPLQNLTADQRIDKLYFHKAIREAIESLTEENVNKVAITGALEKLQDEISVPSNSKGIGIYVSENFSFRTSFPFEVNKKIVTGKSFQLKELLIKEQYALPYTLLYINEKEIRLYNGKLSELNEIKNGEFPMFFEEALETPSPLINSFFARNTYIRNFDRSINEQLEIHHKEFLHKSHKILNPYLQSSEAVILCGVRKYISEFMYHTDRSDKIINILYGNYNRFSEADFGEMIWPSIKNYIDKKIAVELGGYNEKIAEGATEEGIVHVWDAVLADRGETLLVEKNFEVTGFVENSDPSRLYLHPPKNAYKILPDAVDEIIKPALEKGIKIVFTENGKLNKSMGIALVTKF